MMLHTATRSGAPHLWQHGARRPLLAPPRFKVNEATGVTEAPQQPATTQEAKEAAPAPYLDAILLQCGWQCVGCIRCDGAVCQLRDNQSNHQTPSPAPIREPAWRQAAGGVHGLLLGGTQNRVRCVGGKGCVS